MISTSNDTESPLEAGIGLVDLTLRLVGRSCLVVGGGRVAARKVGVLLGGGAAVTVVAPALSTELRAVQQSGALEVWEQRTFIADDVVGRLLVVAATDEAATNRAVAAACRQQGVLVNVVDDPDLCDFFVPATVRRGPLRLSVGTAGMAPALAARISRELAGRYGEQWGEVVMVLGSARRDALTRGMDEAARRRLAQGLAALDFDGLLAEGGVPRVTEAVSACISQYSA
jgi:precorrin-2 dehydrogenase/sirohydrochlorin ferrochelatase